MATWQGAGTGMARWCLHWWKRLRWRNAGATVSNTGTQSAGGEGYVMDGGGGLRANRVTFSNVFCNDEFEFDVTFIIGHYFMRNCKLLDIYVTVTHKIVPNNKKLRRI